MVYFLVVAYTLILIPAFLVLKEDPIYLFNTHQLESLSTIIS